jgi:hypothetical protein
MHGTSSAQRGPVIQSNQASGQTALHRLHLPRGSLALHSTTTSPGFRVADGGHRASLRSLRRVEAVIEPQEALEWRGQRPADHPHAASLPVGLVRLTFAGTEVAA